MDLLIDLFPATTFSRGFGDPAFEIGNGLATDTEFDDVQWHRGLLARLAGRVMGGENLDFLRLADAADIRGQ